MRYFLGYLIFIFLGLFVALQMKTRSNEMGGRNVVKIFASSSFIAQWGPGPWLKEKFEDTCNCKVEFLDGADSTLLFQRLKAEGSQGADLVLGFDQFDLEMVESGLQWRAIDVGGVDFVSEISAIPVQTKLVPYDWSLVSFVLRSSEVKQLPKDLNDLLTEGFQNQIAMEDPRTSSLGLQFLLWLVSARGEDGAFRYIDSFNKVVQSYSPSWSQAYGLFQKSQVKTVLSYVTSPLYHKIEEKDSSVIAPEFSEGHPVQIEYMGIPENCKNCEAAQSFVDLVLSPEGQKIIMEKNYMFPVVNGVKQGTVFSQIPKYEALRLKSFPTIADRERLLKKWTALRRAE